MTRAFIMQQMRERTSTEFEHPIPNDALDYRSDDEKPTKGKAGRRVPIPTSRMPLLTLMREESGGLGRLVSMPPREELARRLRRYLRWAGVTRAELFANDATRKWLTFHDLRGTGITWLAIEGVEPLRIKTWAGHRNFSTTEGTSEKPRTFGPVSGSPSLPSRKPSFPRLNRPANRLTKVLTRRIRTRFRRVWGRPQGDTHITDTARFLEISLRVVA